MIPMHISIVDVRDVAEAHVRALSRGDSGGRYLVVSGQMWWKEVAMAIKKGNPTMKIPTKQIPYFLSLIVSIFHPRVSLSWARMHLGKRLIGMLLRRKRSWDGMESPEESLLDTIPPILENRWVG